MSATASEGAEMTVQIPMNPIVVADRLRKAAASATDENRHDDAFLMNIAANTLGALHVAEVTAPKKTRLEDEFREGRMDSLKYFRRCEPPYNHTDLHDDDALAEVTRLREALMQIERIYYTEGKDCTWRAAHMCGVAGDALTNGGHTDD